MLDHMLDCDWAKVILKATPSTCPDVYTSPPLVYICMGLLRSVYEITSLTCPLAIIAHKGSICTRSFWAASGGTSRANRETLIVLHSFATAPKSAQARTRSAERPASAHERPRTAQERPESAHERPRAAQEGPKMGQNDPSNTTVEMASQN